MNALVIPHGYAYELTTNSAWADAADDDWDVVTYTPVGCEIELGHRVIDGLRCLVFTVPGFDRAWAVNRQRALATVSRHAPHRRP